MTKSYIIAKRSLQVSINNRILFYESHKLIFNRIPIIYISNNLIR